MPGSLLLPTVAFALRRPHSFDAGSRWARCFSHFNFPLSKWRRRKETSNRFAFENYVKRNAVFRSFQSIALESSRTSAVLRIDKWDAFVSDTSVARVWKWRSRCEGMSRLAPAFNEKRWKGREGWGGRRENKSAMTARSMRFFSYCYFVPVNVARVHQCDRL